MITIQKHTRQRLALPPRALTTVALRRSAEALREMQRPAQTPAVIVQHDATEIARLKSELKAAQEARDAAVNAAAQRAHREDRVKAITLRVVDGREVFAAKMGLTQRQPLIVMQSTQLVTADVWQLPPSED